jgi:transcriptional regulator with XRE-family HTH domain
MDGQDIKRWRSMSRLKQEALAEMLGVSHVAVSKWENGHSRPSKVMMVRLQNVMSGTHRGRLAAEIAFAAPQQQMKTLTRGLEMRLIGASRGFLEVYPDFGRLFSTSMRKYVVNEALQYCDGSELLNEACRGEILMLTGVSNRMLAMGPEIEEDFRLRWHTIVRHIDGELIHEVILEPCSASTPLGFERILRRSDVEKFHE